MKDDYLERLLELHKISITEKQIKIVTLKEQLNNALGLVEKLKSVHNCGFRGKCTMKCPCKKWSLFKKEGV